MIREVIFWKNGMVTVYDGDGKQLPEYQGKASEVIDKIVRDAPPYGVSFSIEEWAS